jgi:hypothetical protein
MTRDEILNLEAGSYTDTIIAGRVMKWLNLKGEVWRDHEGFNVTINAFPFSTDLNTVREMEVEIQRRGLSRRYADILGGIVRAQREQAKGISDWWWLIAHADALTKCKAALLTVMEVN